MNILDDVMNLVLPQLCVTCSEPLVCGEKIMCLHCLFHLPRTRYTSLDDNPVARLFWGRVPVQNAVSWFKYYRGSRFQSLIYDLKYRNRPDIGRELGRLLGNELRDTAYAETDLIIPVPLHRRKQIRRGYNQCVPICEGLADSLGIPFSSGLVVKTTGLSSQTDKSRILRWHNVEGTFRVRDPGSFEGRHILIVDDVVTTGSTLESLAGTILEIKGTHVSIATLAVAPKSF